MTGPLQIWRWALHMPSRRLALAQVVLSSIDWLLIAAVLWLLVPGGTVPFGLLLGSLLAAQLLGLVSHVPGGLGVFEGSMLTLLHGDAPPHVLLAGLLLFRIVFYLVPLVVALVIVAAANLSRRPPRVRPSTG
jgi:phosphatidylglycerol lysyltransferase